MRTIKAEYTGSGVKVDALSLNSLTRAVIKLLPLAFSTANLSASNSCFLEDKLARGVKGKVKTGKTKEKRIRGDPVARSVIQYHAKSFIKPISFRSKNQAKQKQQKRKQKILPSFCRCALACNVLIHEQVPPQSHRA